MPASTPRGSVLGLTGTRSQKTQPFGGQCCAFSNAPLYFLPLLSLYKKVDVYICTQRLARVYTLVLSSSSTDTARFRYRKHIHTFCRIDKRKRGNVKLIIM